MAVSSPLIHIVDDDPSVRRACRYMLETVGMVCRDWADGQAFLARADLFAVGVVLLDVRMPGWDGLAVQTHLRRLGSPLAVVMLTAHADVPMASQAFRQGAADFLEKPVALDLLMPTLERAMACSRRAERRWRHRALYQALSARERAVIQGVRIGRTNREIAAEQGVSVRYVEVQRAQAMEKLGAAHMAELIQLLAEIEED